MNIRRFLPVALLATNSTFAQLLAPEPDRLADYLNWFGPLDPTANLVAPAARAPNSLSIDNSLRDWTTWQTNSQPGLLGPIVGSEHDINLEIVFLGQTGTGWDQFGYRVDGIDQQLSESAADRTFGDFIRPGVADGQTLDFFVQRTDGSRYYVFDKSLNSPSAPATDGYWGTLTPLSSVRGPEGLGTADGCIPFCVIAYSPAIDGYETDPSVFIFALRAGFDEPTGVPEPSSYGLAAVAALLALVLRHRWTRAR